MNLSDLCIRKGDKLIVGTTDVFKIIRVREPNRFDIMCICFGDKATKNTGRIWKDISGEHLQKLTTQELKLK